MLTPRKATPKPRRSVRVTDADWRLIEAAAAAADTYPSSYMREAALRQARRDLAGTAHDQD